VFSSLTQPNTKRYQTTDITHQKEDLSYFARKNQRISKQGM